VSARDNNLRVSTQIKSLDSQQPFSSDWLAENAPKDVGAIDVTVDYPIKQVVSGRAGIFNVDLLELQTMTMKDFAAYDAKNSLNCGSTPEDRERKFWELGIILSMVRINLGLYSMIMKAELGTSTN
jgi:hypothetical protein